MRNYESVNHILGKSLGLYNWNLIAQQRDLIRLGVGQ